MKTNAQIIQKSSGDFVNGGEITKVIANDINAGRLKQHEDKQTAKEIDSSINIVEDRILSLQKQLKKLADTEKELAKAVSRCVGSINSSAQRTSDALLKVEKISNIKKLIEYTDQIERLVIVMERLNDLEEKGILKKALEVLK